MTLINFVQALKAASGDGAVRSKRVRPVDLDVYNEPHSASGEQQTVSDLRPPHLILTYVSALRKRVWKFKDVALQTYDKADSAVVNVKEGVIGAYENAKSDPLSMLRPGCITVAVLAGAIVHGRGRKPVLRLTTATIAGTLVAGVAYPDKAVEATKVIYYNGKEASISLVKLAKKWMEQKRVVEVKEITENVVEKAGSNDSIRVELPIEGQGEMGSDFVVLDANGEEVCLLNVEREADPRDSTANISEADKMEENSEIDRKASHIGDHKIIENQEINGGQNDVSSLEHNQVHESLVDYGQSSPEDNDMYSTRS